MFPTIRLASSNIKSNISPYFFIDFVEAFPISKVLFNLVIAVFPFRTDFDLLLLNSGWTSYSVCIK